MIIIDEGDIHFGSLVIVIDEGNSSRLLATVLIEKNSIRVVRGGVKCKISFRIRPKQPRRNIVKTVELHSDVNLAEINRNKSR